MMNKNKKEKLAFFNQAGVTLLELLIALTLFSMIILITAHIFTIVIGAQKDAIVSRRAQEDLRFLLEVASKEIRMAKIDQSGSCISGSPVDAVYFVDDGGKRLTFFNSNKQCMVYYFDVINEKFVIEKDGEKLDVLSDNIKVKDLKFLQYGKIPSEQPRIVMLIKIETGGDDRSTEQIINLQTSISSRHYE